MNLTDSRLTQGGCEKLDLAMLSFCEHFRKIYVGDQVQKTSKVITTSTVSYAKKRTLDFRLENGCECLTKQLSPLRFTEDCQRCWGYMTNQLC